MNVENKKVDQNGHNQMGEYIDDEFKPKVNSFDGFVRNLPVEIEEGQHLHLKQGEYSDILDTDSTGQTEAREKNPG